MPGFIVGKTTVNPAGEPLYRAARRLRLEIEGEMVGQSLADNGLALQAVGLLLQLEGVAREAAAEQPIDTIRRPLELAERQRSS